MLNKNEEQICPWCQSEIVWDPEIGPEAECPHCYNELSGYRTISLDIQPGDEDTELDDPEPEEVDVEWQEETFDDGYGEMVEHLLDEQDEAPACVSCHELMLLAGVRQIGRAEFVPDVPALLGKSFLNPPFEFIVYICPSCFRTESLLADRNRMEMIEVIRDSRVGK
jgi:hypothetical protein